MNYNIFCVLVTLLFTSPLSLFAQSGKGSVSGFLQDTSGTYLPGATVFLKNTSLKSITKDDGSFLIIAPVGSYVLSAELLGYGIEEVPVVISEGNEVNINLVLKESSLIMEEVLVKGSKNYKEDEPSHSLRLQTPILEVPQNIQVVTKDLIQSQQSFDMLETVSRNVSGVQMIEHWGNFARINMRGFNVPAFRNGMNVQMPWGPLSEDMAIVDRIEFVKGPAAFMLSSGEPGGLYNVVTKKPVRNQKNEITLTAGSFNTLRSTIDVGGVADQEGKFLYRLNVMGLTKGAHRDYEFNNRYTVAPSVSYSFNDRTKVTAEYIHQYSQMSVVGAAYVFSPVGLGDLPRDFTLGEPNIDPTNIRENNLFVNVNHKLSSNWELTAQLGYLHYKQIGSSMWPLSLDSAGNMIRGLNVWDALNESKLGQVFLNGNFKTGFINHTLLAGIDMGQKDYFADWFQGGSIGDTFNIYNPQYGVPSSLLPQFDRSLSIRQRAYASYPAITGQRYSSIYIQDQLAFLDNRIRLSLAGRYTAFRGWSYGATTEDHVFTPRVGLSISATKNTSVYALYDQSFLPQSGADRFGQAFSPVRANNVEAGLKRVWANGNWNSTLSVFQITKQNLLTSDPENPMFSIQLGEAVSKGVEVDIQGEIVEGLHVVLNYANTNVEITKDTREDFVGQRIAGHARHMTNGWFTYRFSNTALKGFGISMGYQYQIDRSSWNWSADNESLLPDYFRLDGAVSWEQNNIHIQLNVNNLLNQYLYSGSAYANFYYWQSEPGINTRLTMAYKF